MTKLTRSDRPLVRETAVLERSRPLVVELWPRYLGIRLKGERKVHRVSYSKILLEAARYEADCARAARGHFRITPTPWRQTG